jgi:hypothetical protein
MYSTPFANIVDVEHILKRVHALHVAPVKLSPVGVDVESRLRRSVSGAFDRAHPVVTWQRGSWRGNGDLGK